MTRLRTVQFLDDFRYETGGVCRAVSDLCTLLAGRGHEVTLATLDDTDVPPAWKSGAPGMPRAVRLRKSGRAEAEQLLKGVDSVHMHGMWSLSNIPVAAAARRLGVPYVFSPHGMLDDWSMSQRGLKKRLFLRLVGRRMLERARAVHFTAQGEMDQGRKWFRGDHGRVAPLSMDLSLYRTLPGTGPIFRAFPALAQQRPLVLFLSRVHPKKGLDVLIRAAALLRSQGEPVKLAVAGTGEPEYEREMEKLARDLAIEMTLLGMVQGVEKVSLYQAADVFVLPTHQENFGLVLYEALAAGTPVVTTRAVDPWRELEATGGAIAAEGTPEAIAAAVLPILRDPGGARRMGSAGREAVLKGQEGEHLCRLYESMLMPRRTEAAGQYTHAGVPS